ncbi:hypothetical protein MHU86_9468 [Fragilaria crotonensis]|nr:hypothetical protein MHU86_9468 [Fragilaria crotonensis]
MKVFIKQAQLSFLLLTILASHQLSVQLVHARPFSPFLVPRGGGGDGRGGSKGEPPTTGTGSTTTTTTLGQRIEESVKSIEPQLQNLATSIQHKREITKRCDEMDQQTTLTLKDLDMDLFKLSIHAMILPPGLLPRGGPYQYLHDQVLSLKVDAVQMHSKLKQYIAMMNESLTLLQKLVDAVERIKKDLLQLSKKERRLRWNRGQLLKYEAELQKDAQELKELTLSTAVRVEELERKANQDVWKDFMETATVVQGKAKSIDQFVKNMRANHNHDDAATAANQIVDFLTPPSIVMEEPIEIQVEMTTFHYNG